METISLLGSTMGLGFASGLNLYAAVLTVGFGIRLGLIQSYPNLSHLHVLTNPYVLATAGVLYLTEFFADKIPWVDSVWDTCHTFIRPIGAALVGATAITSSDPVTRTIVMLLCGGVALSGHSTKAGTRLAINHSPEPFSNVLLSVFEDVVAIVGAWLALVRPIVMLIFVLLFLAFFVWISPKLFRLMRIEWTAVFLLVKRLFRLKEAYVVRASDGSTLTVGLGDGHTTGSSPKTLVSAMPEKYEKYCEEKLAPRQTVFCIRCVAGRGLGGLRNSIGYLHRSDSGLAFITRRLFRFRVFPIDINRIQTVQFKKGLLLDRVSWRCGKRTQGLLLFKHPSGHSRQVLELLEQRNNDAP